MFLPAQIKQKLSIYPLSIHEIDQRIVCMADKKTYDVLLVFGKDEDFCGTNQQIDGYRYKECELSVENADAIKKLFPFTRPVSVLKANKTIGLGDRLGLATYGHIRLLKDYPYIRPIFAQQSMRELNLPTAPIGR